MPQPKDMTGQKFGRWSVRDMAGRKGRSGVFWTCECECGTVKEVLGRSLRNGDSKSCGCLKRELSAARLRDPAQHAKTRARKKLTGVNGGRALGAAAFVPVSQDDVARVQAYFSSSSVSTHEGDTVSVASFRPTKPQDVPLPAKMN